MTLVTKPRLQETLLELANLRDDGSERFLRKFKGYYAAEDIRALTNTGQLKIYEYRDVLRKIWAGDGHVAANAVSDWIIETNKRQPFRAMVSSDHTGTTVHVEPNYSILPLSLALGVSELWPKMAICGNPACRSYFFKGRNTQRFCDRGACTAYGQREHKKKWWNEHGAEWKQKRDAKKGKH